MAENILRTRMEAIRRLARRGAQRPLLRVLQKSRAEDVAATMAHLAPAEQRLVFQNVTDEVRAELLVRVEERTFLTMVRDMELGVLVSLLDLMEFDDETDVIARLPEDVREQVLARLHRDDREHVEELLSYPDDSAGGIMSPVAFRMEEHSTCREAIEALQQAEEVESVFYLYVENDAGQLVGVTSLRNLLTNPANTLLGEIMARDVISVHPDADQEEVARVVGRYDLLAVPVVDSGRRLLGIVTVDDVIDVIREEAVEDMMMMVGVQQDGAVEFPSVLVAVRQRVFWLLATLAGGVMAAELIGLWEDAIKSYAVLAGFLPVVLGMGGNVGAQSATITVRGLALGRLHPRDFVRAVWTESRVGVLLGLGYGLLLLAYCAIRYGDLNLGLGVGSAIMFAMVTAATAGTAIPLVLERFRVDPAVATSPFVTTLMDVLGVIIYFTVVLLAIGG